MKDSQRFIAIINTAIRYCKWLIVILVALICCSGIRVVNNHEVAVVLRFGRLVGDTREEQVKEPGLLLAFPYVIDEVIKVPVGKVHEVSITTHAASADPTYAEIEDTGYVINGVVSGVMTSCAAAKSVDGLLTDQKAEFGNEVIRQAQAILDGMEMGVSIVSLEFKSIKPPSALQYHFDQVNAASVEKETRIQQANQYRERVIPEANAAADKLVSDAQVSQHDRINRANDQVAEFYGLFQEYQQNRDVVYERVFREKVVTIFNQMGGKIVLPEGTNTPQIFLP